jgi:hypothetical protein
LWPQTNNSNKREQQFSTLVIIAISVRTQPFASIYLV